MQILGGEMNEDEAGALAVPDILEGLGLRAMDFTTKLSYSLVGLLLLILIIVGIARQSGAIGLFFGVVFVLLVAGLSSPR